MTKLIISIAFIGVSIGSFVLYIQPTYQASQENRIKVARFDKTLSKTRDIQQLKTNLLNKRNTFSKPDLDRLNKMIPDNVDNVRLFLDLDGIASNYGIRIKNVGVKQVSGDVESSKTGAVLNGGSLQSKPYKSLILTFSVTSTYEEFISLLSDLESSLRIVDLTDLTIKPTTNTGMYTFAVSLKTYWLP